MKIAFFCEEYPPKPHGGIGTFVKLVAEGLAQAGYEVKVIEFGEKAGVRLQNSVQVITLATARVAKLSWLINRYRLWQWLFTAGANREIDIFELPEFQGWLPFPVPKDGVTIVVRLHLSGTVILRSAGQPANLRNSVCEYLTLRFHAHWIAVSRFILDQTKDIFRLRPKSSRVVYNPVMVAEAPADPLGQPPHPRISYALFVGSLSERKGVLTIARAAKLLFDQEADLDFVFVGPDGDYQGRPISHTVINIVGSSNAHRMSFLGRLPHREALEWMAQALAVMLPSKLESFGIVPVEAMALGVAAVYSKLPPGPELIQDGVDGILVDPDDPAALAANLMVLLQNPGYAATLGRRARETVRSRFSLAHCLDETTAFYESLLKS